MDSQIHFRQAHINILNLKDEKIKTVLQSTIEGIRFIMLAKLKTKTGLGYSLLFFLTDNKF